MIRVTWGRIPGGIIAEPPELYVWRRGRRRTWHGYRLWPLRDGGKRSSDTASGHRGEHEA